MGVSYFIFTMALFIYIYKDTIFCHLGKFNE